MSLRVLAFCEGSTDFQFCTGLVDRTVSERGLRTKPEWHQRAMDRPFVKWSNVPVLLRELGLRPPHGKFNGGGPDFRAGLNALMIARKLAMTGAKIDILLWQRDADNQPERLEGLNAARATNYLPHDFEVIVGLAVPSIEAWFVAGFDPMNAHEVDCLNRASRDVGFDPRDLAHKLAGRTGPPNRSAKKILELLVGSDVDRRTQCYSNSDLSLLRKRGRNSGLADFLDRIHELFGQERT
jgi:hypothetical protein